jgi:choline kinase
MKAIILSAGQGRRLLPLTAEQPKAALLAGYQSVIEWQLQVISQCDIDDVVVVTGFGAEHIDRLIAEQNHVSARTLYNPFYAHCDNLGTCWVARHEMHVPFVIINGDTLFEAAILRRLLAAENTAPITMVTDSKGDYDDDDMKVIVSGGLVRRVGKRLDSVVVTAESIGMIRFGPAGSQRFRTQIEHMMRYGTGLQQWYLSAVDALAAEDIVATCAIDGHSWCEIDTREDLENAGEIVAAWNLDPDWERKVGA